MRTPDQFNWDNSSQLEREPALLGPALLNHSKEAPHKARTSSQSLKQPCATNATANEATAPAEQACTSNAINEASVVDGALSTLELLELFCDNQEAFLIFLVLH
jgi:hypothetical protein